MQPGSKAVMGLALWFLEREPADRRAVPAQAPLAADAISAPTSTTKIMKAHALTHLGKTRERSDHHHSINEMNDTVEQIWQAYQASLRRPIRI